MSFLDYFSFSHTRSVLTCSTKMSENVENKEDKRGEEENNAKTDQNLDAEEEVLANVPSEPPDPNEPQPTQVPEIQLRVQTSQEQGQKRFHDVVRTVLIVRNWFLNREEEEELKLEDEHKQSTADPFLRNFAASAAESEEQPHIQEEAKTKFTKFARKHLYRPITPDKALHYYWSGIVAVVILYNWLFIVARTSFDELQSDNVKLWFALDYIGDIIYLIDMVCEAKKGYLEEGLLVVSPKKLALHYVKSSNFIVDLISVLPTDVLYFALGSDEPWVRLNRIIRLRRLNEFSDRTETRTSWPNAFRIFKMGLEIFILFHWNACVFFEISKWYGLNTDAWVFGYSKVLNVKYNCQVDDALGNVTCQDVLSFTNLTKQYLLSFYFSSLTLASIGNQPMPQQDLQFIFVILDIILGMLILATIVGNVGSMITNMNASESEFLERLDGVKQYMDYRKVNDGLKRRIIKWFSYIWSQKQSLDEGAILDALPTKLKAELAIHVHMETLRRVRIFQDCDPGLLVELVLKLKLQVFSPGDYICRKGDVGKEMYIVKRGSLNVVAEDGTTVFVTLKEGSVFGELSVLNIPGNKTGNKRSASVRSVGYSDLFVLSKDDLWDALREYPEAKRMLLNKGREILRKDNLLNEDAPAEDDELESLDQKLWRIEKNVKTLELNFDGLYGDFAKQVAVAKQRVTSIETIFRENKKAIKKDVYRGYI